MSYYYLELGWQSSSPVDWSFPGAELEEDLEEYNQDWRYSIGAGDVYSVIR